MSNRVLKKLYYEKDLTAFLQDLGVNELEETASFRGSLENPNYNRFESLNTIEHLLSDTEATEDDDREKEPPQNSQDKNKPETQKPAHSTDRLKKKKKLKSQKSAKENLNDIKDEIEAALRIVNKMLGKPVASADSGSHKHGSERAVHKKSLLSIDLKNLNPDNEMKKIFGSKFFQKKKNKRRVRDRYLGRSPVLVSEENWPDLKTSGLSMNLVKAVKGMKYFMFHHSKQYRSIQRQFLAAVESSNPDNMKALVDKHPYHIDALIQLSDIYRMKEETQKAAELIEQAIFCMECCRHLQFKVETLGCFLDYRVKENRSFYIALYKHLVYLGERGCNKTSLEICKLILSLNPVEDPLGIFLVIDYYAIRSSQYEYLIKFYNEWKSDQDLSQFPNFAFSISLATYLLSIENNKSTSEADAMLQNALMKFPGVLLVLWNRCEVQPDKDVLSHPLFTKSKGFPSEVGRLICLYVMRAHSLWKAPHILHWLGKQVREVMAKYDSKGPLVPECGERNRLKRHLTAENIFRHIILSDIKEAIHFLPRSVTFLPIYGYDPLPPALSVSSYQLEGFSGDALTRNDVSLLLTINMDPISYLNPWRFP